jgi:CTD kinase subunit alpha
MFFSLSVLVVDSWLILDHRLKDIGGEWHELESKALRREKEKKLRAAQQQQQQSESKQEGAIVENSNARGERERKRPNEGGDAAQREAKRQHVDANANGRRG